MSKSFLGDVLSFCQTLPMRDGQAALRFFNRHGDVPQHLTTDFNQFLRARYQTKAA